MVDDHLQTVYIKVQHRDWAWLALSQPAVEVGDQRPAVHQTGEVIMFNQIVELIFGDDAGLQLSE